MSVDEQACDQSVRNGGTCRPATGKWTSVVGAIDTVQMGPNSAKRSSTVLPCLTHARVLSSRSAGFGGQAHNFFGFRKRDHDDAHQVGNDEVARIDHNATTGNRHVDGEFFLAAREHREGGHAA